MAVHVDDINERDENGAGYLHHAAINDDGPVVRWLLQNGADPNQPDHDGRRPLHEAAESKSIVSVALLLENGASPHVHEKHLEQTPLHRAALFGSSEVSERLIEAGADPNARDSNGDTPLHLALSDLTNEKSQLPVINRLLEGGADPDLADRQLGRTPLNLAAVYGKLETADRLLEAGAHTHCPDKDGYSALHVASRCSAALTERLLKAGASPHTHSHSGRTPLHEAASFSSTRSVERLLEAGADPNSRDRHGQTPLHLAASAQSTETVERLIEAGADPNAKNEIGWTPLHSAAVANDMQTIDHLLKAGADMRAHKPGDVGTPLELAKTYKSAEAVGHLARAETVRDSAEQSPSYNRYRRTENTPSNERGETVPQNGKELSQQSNTQHQNHHKENPMPQEHWSKSKSARQFTEQVAERVAKQVEQGKAPWQKGWDKPKGADLQPFNPATLKRFKGLNSVQLRSVAEEKGYNDPRWMSFQAANQIGAKIRKGERGTRVEYLRFPPKSADKDAPGVGADGKLKEPPKISHHTYTVFNAEQIEKMPPLDQQLPKDPQQHEICERAERMIQDSGVKLENPPNGQNFANYDKDRDTIVIPDIEKFKSPEAYYGQAVKEMTNQAGHKAQQDRSEPQNEAQQHTAAARQDMRSEMACLTINEKLHLPKEPTGERHQKQWAETIRKNPNELRYAARDADQIADQVLQHDRPQQRQQSEPSREASTAQVTPERVQETQRALQQPQREMAAAMSR
ncbi:MAG: ankyrin repeat domain-containing protein [Bryobacterales bacterium]|nr:ankyrin repeat domain-containing protein [Bryobacterales bacterium]MDE0296122.1 ankyrin repeat domain-containing protein [Bryobacterales bacterium]